MVCSSRKRKRMKTISREVCICSEGKGHLLECTSSNLFWAKQGSHMAPGFDIIKYKDRKYFHPPLLCNYGILGFGAPLPSLKWPGIKLRKTDTGSYFAETVFNFSTLAAP